MPSPRTLDKLTPQQRLPVPRATACGREVFVELAGAPFGTQVYLESLGSEGPPQRVRAFAQQAAAGVDGARTYRAVLPEPSERLESFVPIAAFAGQEVAGDAVRVGSEAPQPQTPELPPASLQLFAHADALLPKVTNFGHTPEGVRMAFYIQEGQWYGPHIRAQYRSEGGDWLLVRKDGVGIPDLRATLMTEDGSLLYYSLTGFVDLGEDGYARALSNQLPEHAPISVVGRVSTSSKQWSWLNRQTLVGAGTVSLKVGRVRYDIYTIGSPLLRRR